MNDNAIVLEGDCLEVLKDLPDDSVDALVTDPPAGISFMGKGWDGDKGGRKQWVAWMESVMRECLRVMKPGAHGLVWALPRTSHWTATALEDAGFEIRDCVYHVFGSGFPKSLDVSKAIDKAAGKTRPRIPGGQGGLNTILGARKPGEAISGEAISGEAKQWAGWGTALKPAVECWWLVRKPCSEKTVAANVLKWGTGALNIDAGRIENSGKSTARITNAGMRGNNFSGGVTEKGPLGGGHSGGRFPANLVLSCACPDDTQHELECAVKELDRQSGTLKSGAIKPHHVRTTSKTKNTHGERAAPPEQTEASSGGASRFFYCAKISSSERNAGFEDVKTAKVMSTARPNSPDMTGKFPDHDEREKTGNHHPTVKPQKLMRYLIKLVTPPNGVVLDPFMGSGSTGVAALSEGHSFIGVEREPEYIAIAEARLSATKVAS